jgi:hypothetical protein
VAALDFTAVEPGKLFSLETHAMPGLQLRFTCRVETEAGGSRLAQSVDVFGPLAAVVGKPMAKQIAATFDSILAALKQRAEER